MVAKDLLWHDAARWRSDDQRVLAGGVGQACGVAAPAGDLEVLDVHRETAFAFDARGRMVHESSPDRSPGRRFSLVGCRDGNVAVVRADVPETVACELDRLVASEPPLSNPDSDPVHLEAYRNLLGAGMASVEHYHGLLWVFPVPLTYEAEAELVLSGTSEADLLVGRFGEAMPASLIDKGFRTPKDLWEPWCVAVVGGEIASIADTVRAGPGGAEVGVDTAVGFRGRGLAAAASAGWCRHPDLADVIRFYGTGRDNSSSRRVAERLGLRFLGATFAVQ